MKVFGWTLNEYMERLKAIRNLVAGGYGYDSWRDLRKDRSIVAKFNIFHKIKDRFKLFTDITAPLWLKDDWQALASKFAAEVKFTVDNHRKNQAIAQAIKNMSDKSGGDGVA